MTSTHLMGIDALGASPHLSSEIMGGGDSWWQHAFGAFHTGSKVVLSAFGLHDLAEQLERAEAKAGLLPEWARPEDIGPASQEEAPAAEAPPPAPPTDTSSPQYTAAYEEWKRSRTEAERKRAALAKTAAQARLEAARARLRAKGTLLGAEPPVNSLITVRVKNPLEVAARQGAIASLATGVIPETVRSRVIGEMARRLGDDLKANGVEAEVAVIDDRSIRGSSPAPAQDVRTFLIGGAVGLGAGALLWRIFSR